MRNPDEDNPASDGRDRCATKDYEQLVGLLAPYRRELRARAVDYDISITPPENQKRVVYQRIDEEPIRSNQPTDESSRDESMSVQTEWLHSSSRPLDPPQFVRSTTIPDTNYVRTKLMRSPTISSVAVVGSSLNIYNSNHTLFKAPNQCRVTLSLSIKQL